MGMATSRASNRSFEITITNNSQNIFLTSPSVYLHSGYISSLPTPIINPGKKGEATFVKTSGTARGSVGVLTYAFGRTQISMLFSNPFDYNLYPMVFALYIPVVPELTNNNLYQKMYYDLPSCNFFEKAELVSGSKKISVTGSNVVISATIENMENPLINVVITDVYQANEV